MARMTPAQNPLGRSRRSVPGSVHTEFSTRAFTFIVLPSSFPATHPVDFILSWSFPTVKISRTLSINAVKREKLARLDNCRSCNIDVPNERNDASNLREGWPGFGNNPLYVLRGCLLKCRVYGWFPQRRLSSSYLLGLADRTVNYGISQNTDHCGVTLHLHLGCASVGFGPRRGQPVPRAACDCQRPGSRQVLPDDRRP